MSSQRSQSSQAGPRDGDGEERNRHGTPDSPPGSQNRLGGSDPGDGELSEEEPGPEPNREDIVVKPWHVMPVVSLMRNMTPADLVASLKATGEYIGGDGVKERLDSAKLDERGRFMITTDSGEVEEMRWSYAGKGRSAYGFVNGKTGNAYPPHWVAPGSRPMRIEIEDSNVPGMRRKRAIEGGDIYPCNVFNNAQSWQQWYISSSLPAVDSSADDALKQGLNTISTRIKSLNAALLGSGGGEKGKKYTWVISTLGGSSMWPRAERALFVRAGDAVDPGRISSRTEDHDLLTTIGEDQNLRYNSVPNVTVLDRDNHEFYNINWHSAHLLPISTLWEVGFFVRVYKTQAKGGRQPNMGIVFVLESLVAHGRATPSTLLSPPPVKRKVDYFAGADQSKRARSSAASSSQ